MSTVAEIRNTVFGGTITGAIAWGICGVSPITSAAVLGTATMADVVAKAVFKASEEACVGWYLATGLLLGKYLISHFQLPSLSWFPGTVFLLVGSFLVSGVVETALPREKNAPQAAPNN